MSLRARILLLVFVATVVPAALLCSYLFENRQADRIEAGRSLAALAANTAHDLSGKISGTVQLLHGLSRSAELEARDKRPCSIFLGSVLAHYPQYTGILTILPDGQLHCDSLSTGRTLDLTDRAYFKQARMSWDPAYEPVFGRLTGIGLLQIAFPARNASGELKYVLLASLNLAQFAERIATASQQPGTEVLIWDGKGTLMARFPDDGPNKLVGSPLADSALYQFARTAHEGDTAEIAALAGATKLWAAGSLPAISGGGLRITLGLPRDVLMAKADRNLREALTILGIGSLLAFVGALMFAELAIRRQVARIVTAVEHQRAGDADARIGAPYPHGELGGLMAALDVAAASVQSHRVEVEQRSDELRSTAAALRESKAGLHRAQLLAGLAHLVTRPDGSFESWSESLPQLIGHSVETMPKSTRELLKIAHPEDRSKLRSASLDAALKMTRQDVVYRLQRADGTWMHVRQAVEPVEVDTGPARRVRWFSTIQDITASRIAEDKIARLNRVYAVLSGINTLIVRVKSREALYREACKIAVEAGQFSCAWIGMVNHEAKTMDAVAHAGGDVAFASLLRPTVGAAGSAGRGFAARAFAARKYLVCNDIEAERSNVPHADEALARGYRSLIALPLVVDGDPIGTFMIYAGEPQFFDPDEIALLNELAGDISFALEHIAKEEKLKYIASYDELTGLANATLFRERIGQFANVARLESSRVAVVMFDLERFKTINDTLGPRAGDKLLQQIAKRLTLAANNAERVARIGDDRFAAVFPDFAAESGSSNLSYEKYREIFDAPIDLDGTELRVAAKLGIAMFPDDGMDPDTLFRNAESALKDAKASGERYVLYAHQMTARAAGKLALENSLRRALEKQEFVLHYQPKVDLASGAITGVEALIRWNDPQSGMVPPAQFIPMLEETGLILEVGKWALSQAVSDHNHWLELGIAAPRIAVNVSPIQLRQRDFVETVTQVIAAGPHAPGIDLEITESLIMEDIDSNVSKLREIRELGLTIAIDDFGTGYSSLGYLARLPVQSLKIDRSFVITMLDNPDTMALVSTIISLAHSLRLKVVAEGVDNEAQAAQLRLMRCEEMQGFLFSKAVPRDEITALIQQSPPESPTALPPSAKIAGGEKPEGLCLVASR